MRIVRIDARRITDWDAFHDVFAEAFGFPDFYGRNGDAWIDCMGCLDDPEAGMTRVHVGPGEVLTLQLDNVADLRERFREAYDEIIECSAFVNWRRIEIGCPPVLVISFYM
jgi:RNAse (barnase) inhibitor barstar